MNRRKGAVVRNLLRVGTIAFGIAALLLLAGLPLWQRQVIEDVHKQEIWTTQEFTGAILSAYPELELELMELLREENYAYQALGAETLAKYGYTPWRSVLENTRYAQLAQRALFLSTAQFILTGAVFLGLWLLWRQRQTQYSDKISEILVDYLSGDYSFTSSLSAYERRRDNHQTRLEETLRRLGRQFELSSWRLEEEKESTKALVTDISHQLKTPIAALSTCFAMYLEAEEPEERQEFQERCELQIDKLGALTDALMNISRMETAMIELTPAPVTLGEIVVDAVNAIYHKAVGKGIAIDLAEFDPVDLFLDRRWTTEAIVNLLDNAVKYSPGHTQISIEVHNRQNFVRVEVTDQGIGIPREEYNKIFQRFYRGENPAIRTVEGAGVGLYLSRMILEKQGGGLHVRSRPGEGSTFVAQLPKNL